MAKSEQPESVPRAIDAPPEKVLVSRTLMDGLRAFMNRRFDGDRLAHYQTHFIREIDRECGEPITPAPPTGPAARPR